jgi:hypothetical protein
LPGISAFPLLEIRAFFVRVRLTFPFIPVTLSPYYCLWTIGEYPDRVTWIIEIAGSEV